ncbi:P-type conjugative transfer protein TrbJ [Pseudomonas lalucatii]|uniref:P-type conjugative transfer protein TrbJ n=1 Tax=Pseudomonas lalucatii TaxID=1424203 RepID=A0ABS5PZI3_9PSED|nr:P-type conjugative transfer protein TrbJ [Pseudomonas lalucatii]MBS7661633.1 P-type conjugative transfer protein TrbJ [Pseudomonas lalucatii]MBS7723949.1 P-type conjugative transfer protein TrbJ [Pseudomonas lalucatii]QVM88048.1 P-type conjugative transfer protein TrbJ [Pseudomonas lalucatii]
MKPLTRLAPVVTLLTLGLLALRPANAVTVIDPTNLVQNTLTAVRTMEMINNQVSQLQNETQMLLNQARHLAKLDYNAVNRLRVTLASTERLLAEARGLAFEVQRLDREFARLYPAEYASGISGQRLAQEARERWRNGLDGLHTALRVQAQVSQNLAQDESVLAELVQQSQAAGGALQATQATNQLLALQAKQSIQAQQLQITQNRAIALELARQAAAAEEARELRRRFMGSGTPYTPYPVQFYR